MKVTYTNNIPCIDKNVTDEILFNKVQNLKKKIDNVSCKKSWDFFIKLNNIYENVPYMDRKKRVSRAFYKIMEINSKFDLLENVKSCGFLCESPGGFIECVNNTLKNENIKFLSQSLKDSDCKYSYKIKNLCKITYGRDNTGDITKKENIIDFVNNSKNIGHCDYITADGGFDVSGDYLNQEQNSFKLIFCEIITALGSLNKKGNFVCKIFDTYTKVTSEAIYILTCYFEKIYIYKPKLSRPCNSEKYVVCKNFKGISKENFDKLLNLIETDNYIETFGIKLPESFSSKIKFTSTNFMEKQIQALTKVHNMYNNRHFKNKNKIKINNIKCNNDFMCKNYLNEFKII